MNFLADEVRQTADYYFLGLSIFCLVIGRPTPLPASVPELKVIGQGHQAV